MARRRALLLGTAIAVSVLGTNSAEEYATGACPNTLVPRIAFLEKQAQTACKVYTLQSLTPADDIGNAGEAEVCAHQHANARQAHAHTTLTPLH